jgi:ABC-type transport system substrate-binding protein
LKTQFYAPPSANPTHLTAIQQNLKDAGIICDIVPMTQAAFNQAESQGWTNGILSQALPWNPIFAYTLQRMYATTTTFNKSLLRPAGFDDLIIQANSTTDSSKSITLCQQVSTIMQNEALIIPTWSYPQMRFYRDNVHDSGWYRPGYGTMDFTPGKTWKSK